MTHMFVIKRFILYFAFWNIFDQLAALVELPQVEDNDILKTELVIRSTANKLFSNLQLKGIKEKPRLKQYALIHNYFVSITLQDYNNLKQIARLTRVNNKKIDNSTENFIVLLNQVLDEGINSAEVLENSTFRHEDFTEDIVNYIDKNLKEVGYLRHVGANSPRLDINKNILRILTDREHHNANASITKSDEDNILNENEFWNPEESEDNGRRIFKGSSSKIKHFPFMAVVQIFNRFQCGGSIIRSDLIITAASCLQLAWNNRFYRENPAFLSVRVGSSFYDGGGEVVAVLEVYFQPSYNPTNLRHNLAIMRLIRNLKFTKKQVKRIDFDRNEASLPVNTNGVTIVGWGAKTRSNVIHSPWENRLSFSVLDVYPLKDCQDTYSSEYVTNKHFCAGFIATGSGACNRDVGGPGIASGRLVGVVSFGAPQCGTPDHPTVFTKVGYYSDWIEEIMEQEVPRGRKKTTTLAPKISYGYSYLPHYSMFKMDPIGSTMISIPISTTPSTVDLKLLRQVPKGSLFKEFLKTMFDSKEIEEYLDLLVVEKDIGRTQVDTTEMPTEPITTSTTTTVSKRPKISKQPKVSKATKIPKHSQDHSKTPKPPKRHRVHKSPKITEMEPTETIKVVEPTRIMEEEPDFLDSVTARLDRLKFTLIEPFVYEKQQVPQEVDEDLVEDIFDESEMDSKDYENEEKENADDRKDVDIGVKEFEPDGKHLETEIKNSEREAMEFDKDIKPKDATELNDTQERELEKDIMELIDNTDFKELVDDSITVPETAINIGKQGQKDDKIDESILTLLYLSENEKENKKENDDNNIDSNEVKIFNERDDGENVNDLLSDHVKVRMLTDRYNALAKNEELDDDNSKISGEDKEDEAEGGMMIAADADADNFKDFTLRHSNQSNEINEDDNVFSKNVIYDILSEVIESETKNKTI